jgi:enterochelin esterase-like enzyme
MIDESYRTIPFRECTAIGGSSMGGLMALYAAVHHNRWFSKAACISSAIGFCMRPLMADMRASSIDPDTRIYLSWGTKEAWGLKNTDREDRSSKTYDWNKRVADYAAGCGAAVKMRCQVGGGHCEADWEKLVPEFMHFLWME